MQEISVMYVESKNSVEGATEAFHFLESKLPTLKGRKFYGLFHKGNYKAAVEKVNSDDPEKLGLDAGVIPGGEYVKKILKNWPEHTQDIAPTFQSLVSERREDTSRPRIEFYRSQKELVLMLPIK